ncbi:MAG: DUF2007 domain-containing protein [Saprospiraceae bacterium]|nr:DUF2007 domain-containing protein [Saprospiraceae bacterium]
MSTTEILDYFEDATEVIVVRYFAFDSQAQLYAARLREAEIPYFLSNNLTGSMLPLSGYANIALHVKTQDLVQVHQLLTEMDDNARRENESQVITDSSSSHPFSTFGLMILVLLMIVLIIMRYVL